MSLKKKLLRTGLIFTAVFALASAGGYGNHGMETVMAATGSGEYILNDSDTHLYTLSEIKDMTLQELNYARNEIYARHGRKFKSTELTEYFESKSWYHGTIAPEKFDESVLSSTEKKNVDLLLNREYQLSSDGYKLDAYGYDIHAVNTISSAANIEYNDFEETWKEISRHAFEDRVYENTSELAFQFDYSTLTDCGEYCEIYCEIQKPSVWEENLAQGQSVSFTLNELTGETVTLTQGSEFLSGSNGDDYYVYNDNLYYAYGSDDMVYVPFYEGTVRVYKGAPVGYFGKPEYTMSADFDRYEWLNGLSFDEDGYATAMLFYGD